LDAQFFNLAQRRVRVFALADFGDWRSREPVLFERASLSGHPAPSREAGQSVAAALTAGAANGGAGHGARSGHAKDGTLIPQTVGALTDGAHNGGGLNGQDAYTGRIFAVAGGFDVAHSLRAEGFDASEDGTGRGTPLVPVAFDTTQCTSRANRSNPKAGDPCRSLADGAHPPAIAFHNRQDPDISGDVAHPIGAKDNGIGMQIGMNVRRLTPRECERLQGFPDNYTDIRQNGKPTPDGPRYKALGNSMAVPVMRWIGERINLVEAVK
jgi:DNA (cytosine-5)-methyltransferase 1